jgi:threonine dehydrogenase-like Zn-dependent dehydrogenase
VVDDGGEEVVGDGPVGLLAVEGAGEGGVGGEVLDEDAEAAGGEPATVPVEEVGAVVAEQVGFEGLGVLVDESAEAQPSPRVMPVSLP